MVITRKIKVIHAIISLYGRVFLSLAQLFDEYFKYDGRLLTHLEN